MIAPHSVLPLVDCFFINMLQKNNDANKNDLCLISRLFVMLCYMPPQCELSFEHNMWMKVGKLATRVDHLEKLC